MMGAMQMNNLFITILNMSLTGSFVILAVCLARFFLKKSPKIISYCLWIVVGFRLIFPFSIESVFSLIPFDVQPISHVDGYAAFAGGVANGSIATWITIGFFVWLAGVAVMLFYNAASFAILKRKLRQANNVEANIYETKIIKTPNVFGIFSPKIYLPTYLTPQEQRYIVLHEQTHIRRYDHIIKLIAFLVLCLHWLNPLAWLAFLLMSRDMEMTCDECVLKELGGEAETKKGYSSVLLSLANERCIISGSPVAFGSGNISLRIKNILGLKRQSRVNFVACMALVITLSTGLGMNRVSADMTSYNASSQSFGYEAFLFIGGCCDL